MIAIFSRAGLLEVPESMDRLSMRVAGVVLCQMTDGCIALNDRSAKRGEHSPRQRQLVARLPPHDVHVDRRRLETGVTEHPLHEARVTGLHRQPHSEPVA